MGQLTLPIDAQALLLQQGGLQDVAPNFVTIARAVGRLSPTSSLRSIVTRAEAMALGAAAKYPELLAAAAALEQGINVVQPDYARPKRAYLVALAAVLVSANPSTMLPKAGWLPSGPVGSFGGANPEATSTVTGVWYALGIASGTRVGARAGWEGDTSVQFIAPASTQNFYNALIAEIGPESPSCPYRIAAATALGQALLPSTAKAQMEQLKTAFIAGIMAVALFFQP